MTNTADIARAMAATMESASIPMYGNKLRLPDRGAIIALIRELRRLFFPAYFGDPQLMALPAENYAALLLERIETALTAQIALALPESEAVQAAQIAQAVVAELPHIQQVLLTDIEATFDGDPAAANREEIVFAYPGLFAIFVYRIAHELYLRQVPMIPRIMTEYAHSRTGIDIHPGAQIGPWFFIDHGTGIVIGETTVIGSHVKLYQGVTLGALSPRAGHASLPGKRHPTVGDYVTIYSGASILGGKTAIDLPAGKNLAGTFYQPWLVLCDPDCLDSLPDEIFHDGCAEVIKYAVLGNAPFFEELNCTPPHAQLEHIIETCVRMKRDIVAQDEFDRGQRQLLNLGHTFGHGIEACSSFAVSHGSAVAIGMAMIVRAAVQFGFCTTETLDTVLDLLRQYGLPTDCAYPAEQMLGVVLHDKKSSGGSVSLIVPTAVGHCEIRKTPADEISNWLLAGGAQ